MEIISPRGAKPKGPWHAVTIITQGVQCREIPCSSRGIGNGSIMSYRYVGDTPPRGRRFPP
jgi:hypothetical protein